MGCRLVRENNPSWRGGQIVKKCTVCAGRFLVYPYREKTALFCSMLCNNRNPVRIEKRRIKIRDIHKERGRKTSLDKTIRHSFEYKQWRTSIFERDNYTCQICGIRGRDLQADHIKPFAVLLQIHSIDSLVKSLSCNELWNINNGRTLCVQCHKKTGTYGRKLTTKQYENKRANISR